MSLSNSKSKKENFPSNNNKNLNKKNRIGFLIAMIPFLMISSVFLDIIQIISSALFVNLLLLFDVLLLILEYKNYYKEKFKILEEEKKNQTMPNNE